MPRIELTAAVYSVRVANQLKRELSLNVVREIFWTDSQVSLGYIKNETKKFKIFVSKKDQWKYIPTNQNPADLASRGIEADSADKAHFWNYGPDFPWTDESKWNKYDIDCHMQEHNAEVKSMKVNDATIQSSILESLEGIGSWTKLRRVVTLIILFKNKWLKSMKRNPEDTDAGIKFNVDLLNQAENIILKLHQKQCFLEEISALSKTVESKSFANKSSSIYSLDPLLNDNRLLCVRGRLKRSPLNELCIHPALLPKEGYVIQLTIQWCHDETQHSGKGITLSKLRSKGYWVINGNSAVRRLISKSVICKKLRGNTCQQKMSDLPLERLTETPPFTYVGLDLFGPFIVKEGRKELKRYGVNFCPAEQFT